MKKLMLLMVASAILVTSTFANDGQTQPSAKLTHHVKAADVKMAFLDGHLYGSNGIQSTLYITAVNVYTSQTYYVTVYSTFPVNNSDYTTLPPGTYDISVSTGNEYVSYYLSDDDDSQRIWGPYNTFYGITINDSYATVIDVQY